MKRHLALPHGVRPGRLVLAGSGIKGIAHFTLETVAHIQNADVVMYAVADPATEYFIEQTNPKSIDLYKLYDDGKPRHETYTQMAEMLLREVRKGFYVVGVFYGHPGVFVNPSHRALKIAADEGYEAIMLPGVSAEDTLFADLAVDPSRPGCQTVEATDLLLRERPLLTDSHVIIFQVGSVGDVGFNFSGFKNQKFNLLVDRLVADYGEDHVLTHYVAAQYAVSLPVREKCRIRDLRRPEVAKRITGISTFYLPPKKLRLGSEAAAKKLGLKLTGMPYTGAFVPSEPYGRREMKAIADLDKHQTPKNYKKTRTTRAMYETLYDLTLKPRVLDAFRRSPAAFVVNRPGLRPDERAALISRHPGYLRMVMKLSAEDLAAQFVQYEIRNPTIAQQYAQVLQANKNNVDGEANIAAWLKQQGYDTTAAAVYQAFTNLQNQSLDFYDSNYSTFLNGAAGPTILIQKGVLSVNSTAINKFTYAKSVLSWDAADGNPSSAQLNLQVLTNDDGKALPAGAYVGPQFFGLYWASGQNKPTATNIFGKVGPISGGGTGPNGPIIKGNPIETWDDTYQTYLKQSNGQMASDNTLVVAGAGAAATVTYRGKVINKFTYGNDTVAWSVQDGNDQNGSIGFYMNYVSTTQNPTTGNQFFGKVWGPQEQPPTTGNFFGQIGSSTNPNGAAAYGGGQSEWRTIGINLGVGVATMLVGTLVIEAIKAFVKWVRTPSPESQAELNEANNAADQEANNLDAVNEEAGQVNPGAEAVNPGDVPAQAAAEEAAAAEAAEGAAAAEAAEGAAAAEAAEGAAAAEAAEGAAAAEAAEGAAAAEAAEAAAEAAVAEAAAAAAEVAVAEVAVAEVAVAEVAVAEVFVEVVL